MNIAQVWSKLIGSVRKFPNFLLDLLRQLPLIGGLADCTVNDHRLAAKEFFLTIAFSTTTFWVTVIIMRVMATYSESDLLDLIFSTVSNGELLIFSVSFAGPIMIAAMQERSGKSPFPGAIWHIFVLWAFALSASIIFCLLKVQTVAPDANLKLDMGAVRTGSYYIFWIALILRYTTVVYQKMLAAADANGPKQDKVFADRWAAHAQAQNQGQ